MMKYFLSHCFLLCLLCICVNAAYATDELDVTSDSNSVAQASGVANNVNGGMGVGSVEFTQVYEASTPTPFMPGVLMGPVTSPSLFNIHGRPTQATGIPLLSKYVFDTDYYDHSVGKSGATDIIFSAVEFSDIKPLKKWSRKAGRKRVSVNFTGKAEGEVIGSLTIQTRMHKTHKIDVSALVYDARHYISDIYGLRKHTITLLSAPQAISSCSGVTTASQGGVISPVASKLFSTPVTMLGGLSAGYSNTGGTTGPTAIIGCTFLVLAETHDAKVVDFYNDSATKKPENVRPESDGKPDGKPDDASNDEPNDEPNDEVEIDSDERKIRQSTIQHTKR